MNRPISRDEAEKALKGEKRAVVFEVLYFGNDQKFTYTDIDRINFDNVRRLTLAFPQGSGESIYLGNGDWANKDRKKVRRKR